MPAASLCVCSICVLMRRNWQRWRDDWQLSTRDTDRTHTEAVRQDGSARLLKNWKVIQVLRGRFSPARSGQNTRPYTQSTEKLICMYTFETVVWWRRPCCFHFKPFCSLTHTTDTCFSTPSLTPSLTSSLTQRWSMKKLSLHDAAATKMQTRRAHDM